jgi:hypothetical protein
MILPFDAIQRENKFVYKLITAIPSEKKYENSYTIYVQTRSVSERHVTVK